MDAGSSYIHDIGKKMKDLNESRIVIKKEDAFRIIYEINKRASFDEVYKEECIDYPKMVALFDVIDKIANGIATQKDMEIGERCCDKMQFYCILASCLHPLFEGKEFTVSIFYDCIDTMGLFVYDDDEYNKLVCDLIDQYSYKPTEEERNSFFWTKKILHNGDTK
jgi:hypothetical protein